MKNGIYEFSEEFGRQGTLESLIIMTDEDAKWIIGKRVYLDDCLGKHSEVDIVFEAGDYKLITDDEEFIYHALRYFPEGLLSGYDFLSMAKDRVQEDEEYE